MRKYLIAINASSDFAKNIAPFDKVLKKLETMGKLYRHVFMKIYTRHIEIIYFGNEDDFQKRYLPTEKFDETYGFRLDARRYFPMDPDYRISNLETFMARIEALENLLTALDNKADESVKKPIVDHDGNYLEDGEYYVYHECKRCRRKIFIKLNDDCGYDYPSGWARHYGPEIEGSLCPSCEEKFSEMKKDLCIRFLEGEKL